MRCCPLTIECAHVELHTVPPCFDILRPLPDSDQDVQQLLPLCNRLEVLSVSACHQLGNATVAAVGAYLSDCITSLDFSECCMVSVASSIDATFLLCKCTT